MNTKPWRHGVSMYVRYIDRTRDYYLSKGYERPYQWAHFEDVPFTRLSKPLSESRVVLVSTSEIAERGSEEPEADGHQSAGGVYSIASDVPAERLYTRTRSYDRGATLIDDVNAFYPTTWLHQAVDSGRIGSLTSRFHGVYNTYSQRHTRERDCPEVLRRCREDGADVAVLTAI